MVDDEAWRVEQVGEPLGRGGRALEPPPRLGEAARRIVQGADRADKGDERPERHVPVQDLVGAEREDQNPAEGDRRLDHRAHQGLDGDGLELRPPGDVQALGEPLDLGVLRPEGVDDEACAEALLGERHPEARPMAGDASGAPDLRGQARAREDQERNREERAERELPAQEEQGNDEEQDGRDVGDRRDHAGEDEVLGALHVVGQMRQEIAGAPPAERPRREAQEVAVQIGPERAQDRFEDAGLDAGGGVFQCDLEGRQSEEDAREQRQELDLPVDEDRVGDRLRDPDQRHGDERLEHRQPEGDERPMAHGHEVGREAPDQLKKGHGAATAGKRRPGEELSPGAGFWRSRTWPGSTLSPGCGSGCGCADGAACGAPSRSRGEARGSQ